MYISLKKLSLPSGIHSRLVSCTLVSLTSNNDSFLFSPVSITITDFCLSLLRSQRLSYLLLSHTIKTNCSFSEVSDVFFELHSTLLLHFHSHWQYLQTSSHSREASKPRPTVMMFESICKVWKAEVGRWIERGLIGGWCDSRGLALQRLGNNHKDAIGKP